MCLSRIKKSLLWLSVLSIIGLFILIIYICYRENQRELDQDTFHKLVNQLCVNMKKKSFKSAACLGDLSDMIRKLEQIRFAVFIQPDLLKDKFFDKYFYSFKNAVDLIKSNLHLGQDEPIDLKRRFEMFFFHTFSQCNKFGYYTNNQYSANSESFVEKCLLCKNKLADNPFCSLRCGHKFHNFCFKEWLGSNEFCSDICYFCMKVYHRDPLRYSGPFYKYLLGSKYLLLAWRSFGNTE